MSDSDYRVLVVEDEACVRQLTMRALSREGCHCEGACDGDQAWQMLQDNYYDAVITDLRMPNKHGHALATDILAMDVRPLLIVLTGVAEPRLAKDLIARGVDDIVFKPVEYSAFAAKVAAMLMKRKQLPSQPSAHSGRASQEGAGPSPVDQLDEVERVSLADIEARLPHVSSILPMSHAAMDVFNMASSGQFSAQQVAAAVQRDASLAAEVLRLANSSFYNPGNSRITDVEKGIARLGQKRVAELALATNALAALTARMLPWMDVGLAWRRSIAAGVAVELLISEGGHERIQEGLLASAIMHDAGRVVLGTLYPTQYEQMIAKCKKRGVALIEEERKVFPESHAEIMARLLGAWRIPPDICHTLRYVLDEYAYLVRLAEPERTRAELLKVAILIGCLAVEAWEPWDWLEFPSYAVLKRLNISNIGPLIAQTREDLQELVSFQVLPETVPPSIGAKTPAVTSSRPLAYCNLSPQRFDFVAAVLKSSHFRLQPCSETALQQPGDVLINCLSANSEQTRMLRPPGAAGITRLISERAKRDQFNDFGDVVFLPTSYASLMAAAQAVADGNHPVPANSEMSNAAREPAGTASA